MLSNYIYMNCINSLCSSIALFARRLCNTAITQTFLYTALLFLNWTKRQQQKCHPYCVLLDSKQGFYK